MITKAELCELGYAPEATHIDVRSFDIIGWGPSGSVLGGIPEQPVYGAAVISVPVKDVAYISEGRYGATLAYINRGRPFAVEQGPLGRSRRALTLGGQVVSVRVHW